MKQPGIEDLDQGAPESLSGPENRICRSDRSRAAGPDQKILVQISLNYISGSPERLTGVLNAVFVQEKWTLDFWKP